MLGWYGLETGDDGPVVPAEETPTFSSSRPCG